MSSNTVNTVPFQTQAALLERYAQLSPTTSTPELVDFIVNLLRSDQALAGRFFDIRPNAAWAPILWERGFLNTPPEPQTLEGGYRHLPWNAQDFLVSVADQYPDLLLKHVLGLQASGRYLSRAVYGLCLIPVEKAKTVVHKIAEWQRNTETAEAVAEWTFDLMKRFAQAGEAEPAFTLFEELVAPLPSASAKITRGHGMGDESVARFQDGWHSDDVLRIGMENLRNYDPSRVVSIFENSLLIALRQESAARNYDDFEFVSWWRATLEERDEEERSDYKQQLVDVLRDMLLWWTERNADAARPVIERYLGAQHEILYRIAMHVLSRHPDKYPSLVAAELLSAENLEDSRSHQAVLLLLGSGFHYLQPDEQKQLIAAILQGPSEDYLERWVGYATEANPSLDAAEYMGKRKLVWRRDRLWMIGNDLPLGAKTTLEALVAECGEPDSLTMVYGPQTSSFWVRSVSPLSEHEILNMQPSELVAYLLEWKQPVERGFGPEEITYEGLADVLANVVIGYFERYRGDLLAISRCRPEYAYRLLTRFQEDERARPRPWDALVELCERLLADDAIRNDIHRDLDEGWRGVRKAIIVLLQSGLLSEQDAIPATYLSRIQHLLLEMVNDPDPDLANDRPPQGYFGYLDPITVAINHVRPMALHSLIILARRVAKAGVLAEGMPGPRRLEDSISVVLTSKLDRRADASRAVHSVYGRHLLLLYWLDKEWVELHIDDIFPMGQDEEDTWFFVAAMDAFVDYNRPPTHLFQLLRTKYQRAIVCLEQGFVTRPIDGRQGRRLALHLIWDYLLGTWELPASEKPASLVESFFRQAPPEAKSDAVWWLWRIGEENPQDWAKYWPRIRRLWEWRVRLASVANHSPDYDEEMSWFAKLALMAPQEETLASMWPLLEALLPHLARPEYAGIGRIAIREYLAREVKRDPQHAIQLYRLLFDQTPRFSHYDSREHERTIIEVAAADPRSRTDALLLIDAIARGGEPNLYRDIYDRYAH